MTETDTDRDRVEQDIDERERDFLIKIFFKNVLDQQRQTIETCREKSSCPDKSLDVDSENDGCNDSAAEAFNFM